ncbi:MAG: helix-turn-helix domain-containing protein [Desulfovibrionaceae bacterium]|nr:helix-turn-helix domain-containing protein [Desulfovibrionaceae bacterium]
MEKLLFANMRKQLSKTQRELAELLGVSVKSVSSYEQGWRNIPPHVERQLYFLYSRRKEVTERKNCWDVKNCPEERKTKCPAWEFQSGSLCWFINGTICECASKKNWTEKISICKKCAMWKHILGNDDSLLVAAE